MLLRAVFSACSVVVDLQPRLPRSQPSYTKPRVHKSWRPNFREAPNICGSSVRNLLYGTYFAIVHKIILLVQSCIMVCVCVCVCVYVCVCVCSCTKQSSHHSINQPHVSTFLGRFTWYAYAMKVLNLYYSLLCPAFWTQDRYITLDTVPNLFLSTILMKFPLKIQPKTWQFISIGKPTRRTTSHIYLIVEQRSTCKQASSHKTFMTYTWCCMYSLRLMMMDGETVRNMWSVSK